MKHAIDVTAYAPGYPRERRRVLRDVTVREPIEEITEPLARRSIQTGGLDLAPSDDDADEENDMIHTQPMVEKTAKKARK